MMVDSCRPGMVRSLSLNNNLTWIPEEPLLVKNWHVVNRYGKLSKHSGSDLYVRSRQLMHKADSTHAHAGCIVFCVQDKLWKKVSQVFDSYYVHTKKDSDPAKRHVLGILTLSRVCGFLMLTVRLPSTQSTHLCIAVQPTKSGPRFVAAQRGVVPQELCYRQADDPPEDARYRRVLCDLDRISHRCVMLEVQSIYWRDAC